MVLHKYVCIQTTLCLLLLCTSKLCVHVCMSVAMTTIVAMAKNGSIYIHYHMHAKYAMCL